jgi:hypothetical protein
MDFRHDELYCDRTWFDTLSARCVHHLSRCVPRNRAELWTRGFTLFAALCIAWAAGLATQCLLFDLPRNQCVAQLLAAGLLITAAQHFLAATGISARGALSRRKPVTRSITSAQAAPAQGWATAGSTPPRTGILNATVRGEKGIAVEAGASADAQQFFRAVKAAGINVRIARTLYAAGFRNAAQVRGCDDARLLAIAGIGQATLRKLRLQFGLPQSASRAHSNAA